MKHTLLTQTLNYWSVPLNSDTFRMHVMLTVTTLSTVNNIKYFLHENCLFLKLKLVSVAVANIELHSILYSLWLKHFFDVKRDLELRLRQT